MSINSNDHWAFLEEIEAPVWVDLTLEGKFNNQNADDKWFYTHHPVHQSSSHDLKVAFSQLFEEGRALDSELLVSSFQNLPDSVSRSRGKDFNKKSKGKGQDFAMDNKPNIVEKLNSGSASKWKPKSSFTNSKGILSSNSSLVSGESCLTENTMPDVSVTASSSGGKEHSSSGGKEHSSSGGKEQADSRTSSTSITGIGHRQQHKPMEVTSQPLGNSSRLLSDMRRSLRKSCVTRQQASRLEVNNSKKQLSGQNSSSSNSSVCSSLNPGYGAISTQSVGSFSRMTHAAKNKSKASGVFSSTLKIQVEDASSTTKKVGKFNNTKPANLEASKPKILRPKVSLIQKRDERSTCLKQKKQEGLGGTRRCKIAVAGKENATGRIAVSQKCNGRNPCTISMVKDTKTTQHKVPRKLGSRQSVVSSKQQAKNCHPSEGRKLENGIKRVYFR